MKKKNKKAFGRLDKDVYDATMEPYLPKAFRTYIEDEFYAEVGEKAKLDALKKDPTFHKKPINHIGLYSDHSVIHVRDVAMKVIELIEKINGTLIPKRAKSEVEFLKAYAPVSYTHLTLPTNREV